MTNFFSENEIRAMILDSYPVFVRWHRGQTAVIENGVIYYPIRDYEDWLAGHDPID